MIFFVLSFFPFVLLNKDSGYICVQPVPLPRDTSFIEACCATGSCGLVEVNECNKCKLIYIMTKAGISAAGVAGNKVLYVDGSVCNYNEFDVCIEHPTHVLCIVKKSKNPYACEKEHNECTDKIEHKNDCSLASLCSKCLSNDGDCNLCEFIQRFFISAIKE